MVNHYERLSVSRTATPQEITEAYRRIAVRAHPDKNPSNEKEFRGATESYNILRDPIRRKEYDEIMFSPTVNPITFRSKKKVCKGENLRVSIQVTAREIAQCATRTILTSRMGLCKKCHGTRAESGQDKTCPICGGLGYDPISVILSSRSTCETCSGYGRVPEGPLCNRCHGKGLEKEQIRRDITLNPGVRASFILCESGNYSPHGGQTGNLLVDVVVEKDSVYTMHGLKLRRQLKISPAQAVLGDEIVLDVFGTPVTVIIPSGSQPGRLLEIEGAGLSYEGRRGNLEIQLWLEIPDVVDESLLELYKNVRSREKELDDGRIS